jgi:mRNA-degrading endonuclease toxin of MazEF toxin-antitoxin module
MYAQVREVGAPTSLDGWWRNSPQGHRRRSVAPTTSTRRTFPSHVEVEPDAQNRLATTSYVLVEQLRAVSSECCSQSGGNVGAVVAHQITDIIAMIIGLP